MRLLLVWLASANAIFWPTCPPHDPDFKSITHAEQGNQVKVEIRNEAGHALGVHWVDYDGVEHFHTKVSAGSTWKGSSFPGHAFRLRTRQLDVAKEIRVEVVTNLSMIPSVLQAMRRGHAANAWIGFFTFLTSSLYHFCDTTGSTVWGMNAGKWHRLDNIFAILSFIFLAIHMLPYENARSGQSRNDFLRWMAVGVVCVLQEKDPWNELYTAAPVLAAMGGLVLYHVALQLGPQIEKACFRAGLASLALALLGFIKGLDDESDYCRGFHGLWHLAVGAFSYFMSEGRYAGKHGGSVIGAGESGEKDEASGQSKAKAM